MSGFMHITGFPDGPPTKVGYAITDILTGHQVSQGILAALIQRSITNKGQKLETSLLESALYSLSYVAASHLLGDQDYQRMGNSHPLISPYSAYQSADGHWLVLGIATDK